MKVFYGWIIALAAMIVLWITNGLTIPGITAFDPAFLAEFGWSRGSLKFGGLLTFAVAGLLAPFAGALADRFGVRRLMLFGAVLLAVSFVLYSRIESLRHLYAIHVLFALVLVTCGLVMAVILVSHWFEKRRGTAIGIALVGTSLGGVVFPKLGTWWIEEHGWRQAMLREAIFPAVLVVLIFLLVRDRPEEKGLQPLGSAGGPDAGDGGLPRRAALSGLDYGVALKTPTFWALAIAAMATFYSILGFQANLILHLRDLGFEPQEAASGLSLLFLMALVGKFTFGFLADHLPNKAVFLGNLAVMLVGAVLLATMSVPLLRPAIVLFGLGWGGLYTLIQLLAMDCFGLKAGGKILGTITTFDALGGGAGIWLTGLLYDRTGSYETAFLVVTALIFSALLAATQVKSYVHGEDAA